MSLFAAEERLYVTVSDTALIRVMSEIMCFLSRVLFWDMLSVFVDIEKRNDFLKDKFLYAVNILLLIKMMVER